MREHGNPVDMKLLARDRQAVIEFVFAEGFKWYRPLQSVYRCDYQRLPLKTMKGACIAPNKTGASTGSPCALNP